MKTMRLIFACAFAFTVVIGQTPSTHPKPKEIFFDFRVDRPINAARISGATQKIVLSKVFRKYLTDESKCNADFDARGSTDPLKAARNAGQIVPSISDIATGSFTKPGQVQTAYVLSVSECNASHADNFGTKRIAIFSGNQLLLDVDADFKNSIVRKTDLDGDGLEELLMTGGDMNQGVLVETAALVDFRNGRLRTIRDFGTVVEDSCASEERGSAAKAAVISILPAAPGDMPKFRVDNYRAACSKAKRWRFLSTGRMPD